MWWLHVIVRVFSSQLACCSCGNPRCDRDLLLVNYLLSRLTLVVCRLDASQSLHAFLFAKFLALGTVFAAARVSLRHVRRLRCLLLLLILNRLSSILLVGLDQAAEM